MASSKSSSPAHIAPRLYLATPALADTAAHAASLPPLLAEFDVAALLLRLNDADERTLTTRIKTLAGPVQAAGTALLVDRHANLVARAGADGAHVDGLQAMGEAASLLPRRGRKPCCLPAPALTSSWSRISSGAIRADRKPPSPKRRPRLPSVSSRRSAQHWRHTHEPQLLSHRHTDRRNALPCERS